MPLKIVSNFSARLNEALNGMTLTELALKIGMSKQSLSAYSLGIRNPKQPTIKAISESLNVNPAWICGYDVSKHLDIMPSNALPLRPEYSIPILGTIRAGYGSQAVQDVLGYANTEHPHPESCFWLRVKGNSMEPRLFEDDLVLIDKDATVDSGNIVAVIVNGEEGTVKKYEKKNNAIVLKPLNSACETRVFVDAEQNEVYVVGRVIEIKAIL